jgi:signal transduction histidine kinase
MQDIREYVADPDRLEAVRETGLLDSEMEEEFDRLTRLASTLLGAPATFFSLVDQDRDFYKSCFGFAEPLASERGLTGVTFCHYSIVSDGALVIPDTRADPVYRQVPPVEALGVAAYLGVPVRAPGDEVLGSFCAIDFRPREWTPTEVETMKELAKSAEREVAVRHWMRRQRQLTERETAAREELERVMESRTRLVRGFSHDLKNPLGSADGFMALLEDGIVGPLEPKQEEKVKRARRALRRALDLIDELVAIAVLEEGRLEIRALPVSLRGLVREMVEEYRPQAEGKGLGIRCDTPDALPLVRTDDTRLRQVLGNLLSNAIKFTEAGEIVVRLGARDAPGGGADAGPDGDDRRASTDGIRHVAIDVIDTGIGIAKSDLDRLFEEFVRLEPATTSGAGLGLAISQKLAHLLGGSISVTSELGRTSTFTLWLPLDRAEQRPGHPAGPELAEVER